MATVIESQAKPSLYRFTQEQFERMAGLGWFESGLTILRDGQVFEKRPSGNGVEPVCWTADKLYQMLEMNWFVDNRVELINGEILEMASQKNLHMAGITLTADALRAAFGKAFWVRVQGTLDLSPFSSPDPDIAVIPGSPRKPSKRNPVTALLVVEISDTSLYFDRNDKKHLYAAAGIADYCIVNLVQRQVEVYRQAVADPTKLLGFNYADFTVFRPGESIRPLRLTRKKVAVDDMLP